MRKIKYTISRIYYGFIKMLLFYKPFAYKIKIEFTDKIKITNKNGLITECHFEKTDNIVY